MREMVEDIQISERLIVGSVDPLVSRDLLKINLARIPLDHERVAMMGLKGNEFVTDQKLRAGQKFRKAVSISGFELEEQIGRSGVFEHVSKALKGRVGHSSFLLRAITDGQRVGRIATITERLFR